MKNKRLIGIQKINTQLKSNYGIGKYQSKYICHQLGISLNIRNNQMTKYEKLKIMDYLRKRTRIIDMATNVGNNQLVTLHTPQGSNSQYKFNKNRWKFIVSSNKLFNLSKYNKLPILDNLKYIQRNVILEQINKNSYRGFRHKKGLPVRGQRTRTNRQTRKRLARRRI